MIKSNYRYLPKRFIMNRNEYGFFKILIDAVGDKYVIIPQVHLDELVKPSEKGRSRIFSFRHINQKSVDYVLCSKNGMVPRLAIELDGSSHHTSLYKEIDKEKESIMDSVGLKWIRYDNNTKLSVEELRNSIEQKLAS